MSAASGTSDYFVSKSREAIAGGQMDGNRRQQRPPRANTGNPSFYPPQPMLPSKAFNPKYNTRHGRNVTEFSFEFSISSFGWRLR